MHHLDVLPLEATATHCGSIDVTVFFILEILEFTVIVMLTAIILVLAAHGLVML